PRRFFISRPTAVDSRRRPQSIYELPLRISFELLAKLANMDAQILVIGPGHQSPKPPSAAGDVSELFRDGGQVVEVYHIPLRVSPVSRPRMVTMRLTRSGGRHTRHDAASRDTPRRRVNSARGETRRGPGQRGARRVGGVAWEPNQCDAALGAASRERHNSDGELPRIPRAPPSPIHEAPRR